jgi:hypothetical protein
MQKKPLLLLGLLTTLASVPLAAQHAWTEVGNKENAPKIAEAAGFSRAGNGDFLAIFDDNGPYGEQRAKVKRYNGATWTDLGEDAISAGKAVDVSVAEFNGSIYAVYRASPMDKTFMMKFDGSKWNPAGEFGYTTDNTLLTDGSTLYFACYSGGEKLRITVYVLEGNTWKETGAGGLLEKDSNAPFDVQLNNGQLYIAYTNKTGNGEGKVKKLEANKWVPVGPLVTDFTVKQIRLSFHDNTPYVAAYSDKDYLVYVKKYIKIKDKNNQDKWTWTAAGPDNGVAVKDFKDKLNFVMANGQPYIIYEQDRSDKISFVTLSDNAWTPAAAGRAVTDDTDAGLATKIIMAPGKIYTLFKDPNNNGVAIKQLPVK